MEQGTSVEQLQPQPSSAPDVLDEAIPAPSPVHIQEEPSSVSLPKSQTQPPIEIPTSIPEPPVISVPHTGEPLISSP